MFCKGPQNLRSSLGSSRCRRLKTHDSKPPTTSGALSKRHPPSGHFRGVTPPKWCKLLLSVTSVTTEQGRAKDAHYLAHMLSDPLAGQVPHLASWVSSSAGSKRTGKRDALLSSIFTRQRMARTVLSRARA
ncbi:hypothetical protein PLICRDRAFT_367264 [Plicaturopsis crispa FD-325 SS-3]|uniref:Uncharacterized protein n=1 Tax=Plicaturopsis crispa FD-325 SS-3 TaxID=944288 RepID=A0A0C9SKN6_PLICR|nr:hypothetical protein PLICRDRAFT_367264 [Plicaturopsis crispa FD-325 SS-3]